MLRGLLSQTAARACELAALRDSLLAAPWVASRAGAAQQLVSLRGFSTGEDREADAAAAPAGAGAAAAAEDEEASAAPATSPKLQGKMWRQWVEGKLDEKLEAAVEAKPKRGASKAAAAAAAEAAASAAPEGDLPDAAAPLADVLADAATPPSAAPKRAKSLRLAEDTIFDIIVPRGARGGPGAGGPPAMPYTALGDAKDAPRVTAGFTLKADELSPARLHPHRLFYPSQLYSPQDLDPYHEEGGGADGGAAGAASTVQWAKFATARRAAASAAEVLTSADFRNPQFLSAFVSDAGKLVPRRRTRLQAKVHRHLHRQIKLARCMAILPPTSKLPQFMPGGFKKQQQQQRAAAGGPPPASA